MQIALPAWLWRDASSEAALPSWALPLWRLALIAVGDDRSATALVAEVIAQNPDSEGEAVKLLATSLPEGWLSWPGAAGPGEWLRLKLRREQVDQLLSILGEWRAQERMALGLYLWWDVPREELDAWLGTTGMSVAVVELIVRVGHYLGYIDQSSDDPVCESFHSDLLEALEPATPQSIRLHLTACHVCRMYANGLRRSTQVVQHALEVFFRQTPPPDLAGRAAKVRRERRRVIVVPNAAVPVLIVALLTIVVWLRPHAASPAAAELPARPVLSAADVLDRALDRFAEPPASGVIHEYARVGSGEYVLLVERWFDRQRIRITVHSAQENRPLFDLSSDGKEWISYQFTPVVGMNDEALLRSPDVPAMLPLLRQLPFAGSFGSMPVDQRTMDVALLAQAQRGSPALLGTTHVLERSAYLLSSTQTDGTRVLLSIDQRSFNLLEAQVIAPNATTPRTVWQAEVVEERRSAPSDTFKPLSQRAVRRHINPRHIMSDRASARLTDATVFMKVPLPMALPEPPIIRYLRTLDGQSLGVLQMYEGEWSTLAIVTPRLHHDLQWTELPQHRFEHGRYMPIPITMPQATLMEFILDRDPEHRSTVYFWHAFADEEARERMIIDLLNSLEIVDQTNAERYADRFDAPITPHAIPVTSRPPASLRTQPGQ